jgi:hypothetical protein
VHVTNLLRDRRGRIERLVDDIARDPERGDTRQDELTEAVEELVLLEQAALHLLLPPDAEADYHRRAHERARIALFRVVGSARSSAARAGALRDLAAVFGDRSSALVDHLARALDDAELAHVGGRFSALLAAQ